MRSVEKVWLRCRQMGRPFPSEVWLQSDNTVKELRNQFGSKMAGCMVQASLFKTAGLYHLPVGHTHEDVDMVFSLVANSVKACGTIETPRDLARQIETKVGPVFTGKGLLFSVEIVEIVPWLCCLTRMLVSNDISILSSDPRLDCYPSFLYVFEECIPSATGSR